MNIGKILSILDLKMRKSDDMKNMEKLEGYFRNKGAYQNVNLDFKQKMKDTMTNSKTKLQMNLITDSLITRLKVKKKKYFKLEKCEVSRLGLHFE